jgi:hypothetical protein
MMPAIDVYTCEKCDLDNEHFRKSMNADPIPMIECECGGTAFYNFAATCLPSQPKKAFEPYWEEHIHPYPVYVTSAKDIDNECKKRGGLALTKAHKRAPEYCRQGSTMSPPTHKERMAWLKENRR